MNNLRKPKGGAVEAEDDGELGEAKDPNSLGTKGILQTEGVFAFGEFAVLFFLEFFKNHRLFPRGKPMGTFGAIGQKEGDGQPDEDRGDSFQKKEPLPGVESVPTVGNLENPTGNGTAKSTSCGDGGHEHGGHMSPVLAWEPIGQVKDDAGEKSGFGDAKKEAEDVEGGSAVAEGHQGGDNSPADHDAGDPESGSRPVENEVSGNLEEEVTEKEDAGSGGEDGIREPRDLMHGQFGEADIDPVDISQDVTRKEDGDEPEGDFAVDEAGR